MRESYEIYDSLRSSFLSTQNSIDDVPSGSIISSLLYANSVEIARAFEEIDSFKSRMYVNTATGIYLDFLIGGFSRLVRIQATHSVGYVLVELGTSLTLDNLDLLRFSFSQFSSSAEVAYGYPNTVRFTINNKNNQGVDYTIINPLNYEFAEQDFIVDSANGTQQILKYYKEYLKVLLRKYNKPIKYLVLPVASINTGAAANLPSGNVEISINLGFPCIVTNPYTFDAAAKNAFFAIKDLTSTSNVIAADIDNIVASNANNYGLAEFSYISGAVDTESDDAYRSRFYNHLDSLSKGTASAINLAVISEFPNSKISILNTSNPGVLDVYIDTNFVLSKPILQRIAESIDSVKPAGISVNVKPTKNIYLSVVSDIETTTFSDSVNTIKESLFNSIDTKVLGDTLSYDELLNFLDERNVTKKDNTFYGEFLNPALFSLYKETFQKMYYRFGVRATSTVLPSDPEPWKYITYFDVYDQVINNEEKIYINYKNAVPNYPLISLVKAAIDMDDATKGSLPTNNIAIVDKIKDLCAGKKLSQCLSMHVFPKQNVLQNKFDFSDLTNVEKISIADIRRIVSKEYANYYKIKLLTAPAVRYESSETSIPLIEKVLMNDVIYLTYDELVDINVKGLEKIKLARDFNLSNGIYLDSAVFGARNLER